MADKITPLRHAPPAVPQLRRSTSYEGETEASLARPAAVSRHVALNAAPVGVDLSGKPKVWFVIGPGRSGKAQPLDSRVLTPTGFRPMGSLAVGDIVTCPDGQTAGILGVFPQGEKEIVRIEFHDGRMVECCEDHLWKVWTPDGIAETGRTHATRKKLAAGQWKVESTAAIRHRIADGQHSPRAKRRVRELGISVVAPFALELPSQTLPIPPYVLGVLIGDGSFVSGTVNVSNPDVDILRRVRLELPTYDLISTGDSRGLDYRFKMSDAYKSELKVRRAANLSPLTIELKRLGLFGCHSYAKFVPDNYKHGSVAQRLALLQGLLDTDGSAAGMSATFTSTSERLARDVQEIAWSLGALARISPRQTYFTYKGERKPGRPSWRVSIVHPDIAQMFSLPRHVQKCVPKRVQHRLRIVSITPVGRKLAQCIAVDHPNSLYVTDNYVVTHNTTLLRYAAERLAESEGAALLAALDPQNRSLAHYVENVVQPEADDAAAVARWLEELLLAMMEQRGSALLDMGGGDTSLRKVLADLPDLVGALEGAGISPVAVYTLSPRVDDLASLAEFEGCGFQPRATALVLNEGLADPTIPREEAFGRLLRHSVFRAAVARGAVTLWMPRLDAAVAAEIEAKRVGFGQARDAQSPKSRPSAPLGPFNRLRVRTWMTAMDAMLVPVRSWLP